MGAVAQHGRAHQRAFFDSAARSSACGKFCYLQVEGFQLFLPAIKHAVGRYGNKSNRLFPLSGYQDIRFERVAYSALYRYLRYGAGFNIADLYKRGNIVLQVYLFGKGTPAADIRGSTRVFVTDTFVSCCAKEAEPAQQAIHRHTKNFFIPE